MTATKKNIQLFVPTFRVDECLEEIRECLEKGWTGLGFKTLDLEERWKEYTGLPHAHYLNSATAGLRYAVKLLKQKHGWSDGDEIISTPITFVSTNHAILYEDMRVVFADVDHFGCLDPDSVEAAITPNTRAVMFVGLGGNTGQYDRIVQICRERGLQLILDAAHMAGTRLRGVTPGQEADAVVYSFQAVKNLPTADSGMVCFQDGDLDKLVRQLSWLGIDKDTFTRSQSGGVYKWYYDVPSLGFKDHGNSIMASMGLVQLRYLDQDNAYRRQLATWYEGALSGEVDFVPVAEGCESSRHLFQVRVPRRDEVLMALNGAGVFPGVHYRDNSEFTMYANQGKPCERARSFSDSVISLPMHLRLTRADVMFVCETLKQVLAVH
ncbi:DegT/DnrJ/EryC1/StrS aminotransferase family protein (plasmid) [Aminobacter sp. NyZ550]|uniref:DegT/DnrJ/EryC1/StrS family aminotransferase n=1 Tax=Aminobacter sp. NyZ550 TaxID=2979870 RepID=UPI0021D60657|nr:DegT/DnrJ/EryC1/StrS aminotransferase family protein [Aminobacter sp. NyZ550]WAX98155.1 DegT/DnrJ/EryC1/StrS aminotransferase family protein [Aminobacter sp. NyZ550]